MKATMDANGNLVITPESGVEAYALRRWSDRYDQHQSQPENQQVGYQSHLLIDASWPPKEDL